MGRSISVMAHLKKSIVQVKSETNCLAQDLIIANAKATKDPNYKAYRQGRKIYPKVEQLQVSALTMVGESQNSSVFWTIFDTISSLCRPG